MTTPSPAQARFPLWLIVASGCLIAAVSFGPRSAMGFFQLPILGEKGWDRTTFSVAMAIQNLLWGFGQPLFGAFADRFGSVKALLLGAGFYAAGLVLMAFAASPIWLHVGGGVLVGLGVAGTSFGIVLAAFARAVTPQQRSFVFGLGTAAGSFGMFLYSPLSQAFIDAFGWVNALLIMAGMLAIIPLAAFPLAGKGEGRKAGEVDQSIREALAEALGHRSYLLLVAGFFVCGFQVAFITAHFPAYIRDIGLEPKWGVYALMLIGLFNIVGSIASGIIGNRHSKPIFLALIYLGRSLAVTVFLWLPPSPANVMAFAVVMGLLWLSTVPPTNGLVAIMFGTRYLGMLGGIVFLSHQVGSFLGVWLGGWLYDRTGSYDVVWWLGVALGIFAAIVHWPIREQAVERRKLAAAE